MTMTSSQIRQLAAQAQRGHRKSIGDLGREIGGHTLDVVAGNGINGIAAIYKTGVQRIGDIIKTAILIDLTGLRSTALGDIIGDDGTSEACHIGRITTPKNGIIVSGRVTCLEAPAGGDPDIDLYAADEATGTEDDAISGLTETQLTNGGDHTLGGVDVLTALPGAGQYLYLVAGATTDADYTAGKLLIELEGYEA